MKDGFTGCSYRAMVHEGVGYLMEAVHTTHPCGCKITGNGTLTHPLTVVHCELHKGAVEFVGKMNRHVIKCARRGTNLDHYPADWAPLKKQLAELVSKLS